MKKNAVSLVELILVMVLSGILLLSLACGFVAMASFNNVLRDNAELARDARFATYHMTRFLRFGIKNQAYIQDGGSTILAAIDKTTEHFPAGPIPADAIGIVYKKIGSDLSFWMVSDIDATPDPEKHKITEPVTTITTISYNVYYLNMQLSDGVLTIKFKFSKNNGVTVIPIETKVKMLH